MKCVGTINVIPFTYGLHVIFCNKLWLYVTNIFYNFTDLSVDLGVWGEGANDVSLILGRGKASMLPYV